MQVPLHHNHWCRLQHDGMKGDVTIAIVGVWNRSFLSPISSKWIYTKLVEVEWWGGSFSRIPMMFWWRKFLGFQLWLHQATMAWQKGKLRVLLSQWKAETVENTRRKLGEKPPPPPPPTTTTINNNKPQQTTNNQQTTKNQRTTNKQTTKKQQKKQQTTNRHWSAPQKNVIYAVISISSRTGTFTYTWMAYFHSS